MNSPSFDIVFYEIPWNAWWVWGGLTVLALIAAVAGAVIWQQSRSAAGRLLVGLAPLPLIVGGVWEVIVARMGIDSVAGTLMLMACAVLAGGLAGWWSRAAPSPAVQRDEAAPAGDCGPQAG